MHPSNHLFGIQLFLSSCFSLELFLQPNNLEISGLSTICFQTLRGEFEHHFGPQWMAFYPCPNYTRMWENGGLNGSSTKTEYPVWIYPSVPWLPVHNNGHDDHWNLTSCLFRSSTSTSLNEREHKGQLQLKPKLWIVITIVSLFINTLFDKSSAPPSKTIDNFTSFKSFRLWALVVKSSFNGVLVN